MPSQKLLGGGRHFLDTILVRQRSSIGQTMLTPSPSGATAGLLPSSVVDQDLLTVEKDALSSQL